MRELQAAFEWRPEPWMKEANCKGADPNLFVLDQGVTTAIAKRYCMACEVRQECADYARRTDSIGVFGGKLFTFRFSEPVELMPIRQLQDARPRHIVDERRKSGYGPSILGKAASFSRPSILGR